jgi:hypothetical protein
MRDGMVFWTRSFCFAWSKLDIKRSLNSLILFGRTIILLISITSASVGTTNKMEFFRLRLP